VRPSGSAGPVPVVSGSLRFAARLALLVELGCIAWLAVGDEAYQAQIQSLLMVGDKTAHLLAFFVTGVTAAVASRSPVVSALVLGGVAGGVEILQTLVPGRTASLLDFAASLAGVTAGVVLGAVFWPRLLARRRNRV